MKTDLDVNHHPTSEWEKSSDLLVTSEQTDEGLGN